jgi:FtsZ-binding cell division protein ZapB
MNREVLLQSLEDFMQETDTRLTALEAAKPQAQPGWFDVAKQYAAENESLKTDVNNLVDTASRLADDVIVLKAERNALADEVDDLRNVNAGLRKENARLTAERDAAKREVAELLQSNANLSDKLYG